MKIILFGKNGQLGKSLQDDLANSTHELIAFDRQGADLEHPETLRSVIQNQKPDIIINAAAYTQVDLAEDDRERAQTVNALAPAVIAEEAHKLNAWLIHYSTDYVYDGTKATAYIESDQPNPLSIYGQSKNEGDQLIAARHNKYIILRTSWCYSVKGKNFAKTILQLSQTKDHLNIVSDQVGAPTSTDRIASVTREIIAKVEGGLSPEKSGIYHLTADGETSWYEYARFLVERAQKYHIPLSLSSNKISPISTESYKAKANRPKNSRLNSDKIKRTFQIILPNWQDDVESFVETYCQSLTDKKEIA